MNRAEAYVRLHAQSGGWGRTIVLGGGVTRVGGHRRGHARLRRAAARARRRLTNRRRSRSPRPPPPGSRATRC